MLLRPHAHAQTAASASVDAANSLEYAHESCDPWTRHSPPKCKDLEVLPNNRTSSAIYFADEPVVCET